MDRKSTKQPGKAKAVATQAPASVTSPVIAPVTKPEIAATVVADGKTVAAKTAAPKLAAAPPSPVATALVKPAAKVTVVATKPALFPISAVPETVRALTAQGLASSQQQYVQVRETAENFNASVDARLRKAITGFQTLNAQALDLCLNHGKAQIHLATALAASNNPAEAAKLAQDFTQTQFKAWQSFGEAWLQAVRHSGTGMFKA